MSPQVVNVEFGVEDLQKFEKIVVEKAKTLQLKEMRALLNLEKKYDGVEFENLTGRQLELLAKVVEIKTPAELTLNQLLEWAKKFGRKIHFNVFFAEREFFIGAIVVSKKILDVPGGEAFVMDLTNRLTEGKKWEDGAFALADDWILFLEETKTQFVFDFDRIGGDDL